MLRIFSEKNSRKHWAGFVTCDGEKEMNHDQAEHSDDAREFVELRCFLEVVRKRITFWRR